MIRFALFIALAIVVAGCASTPSDADQQKLVEDWAPEKVAQEYEKKGMMKEAEEVRRSAKLDQGGG